MTTQHTHETVDILALHDKAHDRERHERIGSIAVGALLAGASLLRGRPVTRIVLGTMGGLLIARGISGLSVKQLGTFVKNLFKDRSDLERRNYSSPFWPLGLFKARSRHSIMCSSRNGLLR